MSVAGGYKAFIFESFGFDDRTGRAEFNYSFDGQLKFTETIEFDPPQDFYCGEVLQSALFYCHIVLGTSYYKLFPGASMEVKSGSMTSSQAKFFTDTYRGGLGQFLYENSLRPEDISEFMATAEDDQHSSYRIDGSRVLLMQSGGKDSLLAAKLLLAGGHEFDAWHMSSTGHHPSVIESIGAQSIVDIKRNIDLPRIRQAMEQGGLNGHVPFSAITAGLAVISSVLHKRRYIIAAMEASSDEPNTFIGDFPVNHMYSKTFDFEKSLQEYIHSNIATDLDYLSLIRGFSDLRVAELFADLAWPDFGSSFASCNVANYKQGEDDGELTWCGECSKCANSFLLFSAFVDYDDLVGVFSGKNLYEVPGLLDDFKALLGIGGIKPFECVGTVEELRAAYHLAGVRDSRYVIESIEVPKSKEDFRQIYPHQPIADKFLNGLES